MPYSEWVNITDGAEQGSRFPAALEAGYFNVDELSFSDLLAMGADLAARLNFYNQMYEKDGNWQDLFSGDETVVMAMIMSKDLKKLETEFLRFFAMSRNSLLLARRLVRFAAMIDFWYRKLAPIDRAPARALSGQIAAVVEKKLAADLHLLGACLRMLRQGDGEQDDALFAGFDGIWRIGREDGRPRFDMSGISAPKGAGQIRLFLRATFYSFHNAVSFLKKVAAAHLEETLSGGSHSPAMALFMAFLTLYRKAQEKVNAFQERHLDFYYRRMLHLSPELPKADATYLLFDADTASSDITVAAGTEFPAGKDGNGNEIFFRADNDLLVTDVRVQALRTLFFERDRLISPERELNYVTRVQASSIPLPEKGEDSSKVSWPLFGAADGGKVQASGCAAGLGFALASEVLLLREGWRAVDVTVCFTRQTTSESEVGRCLSDLCEKTVSEATFFKYFGAVFNRYLLANRTLLNKDDKDLILKKASSFLSPASYANVEDLLRQDCQDLFFTLMPKIFSVELTGEKGWHRVRAVAVKRVSCGERRILDGLKFSFTLGPDVESMIPYTPGLHGPGFETMLPLVRFRINEHANFFPYSLFDGIAVKEFQVDVAVSGVSQLLAYNNLGQLDPAKPFTPFGPLPSGSSYLVLGNYEAALKSLTSLSLNIEWGDLPGSREGFGEHYLEYEQKYSNESFTVEVALLRDGNWLSQPPGVNVSLFESLENSDVLSPNRSIPVAALNYFRPLEPSLPEELYRFDLRVRNGFFKLGLLGPEGAFGHKEYPRLLTAVLSENARKKPREHSPLPSAPYTPLINRITLDYAARSIIKAGIDPMTVSNTYAAKPFHIHPFGTEPILVQEDRRMHYLLPNYGFDGNLFIGFSSARPGGVLTLFFHLREDSRRDSAAEPPKIVWFYLASNRWRHLSAARILSDTTDGFLTSGIVTLDIPASIDQQNSIMPENLYWLRVVASSGLDSFCSLHVVRAQALRASRCIEGAPDVTEAVIPAATIRAPLKSIAGLAGVSQPLDSFDGRRQEGMTHLKTRSAERLRHKNRAVMPWDYERMVLEQFPQVFKVKCFSGMSSTEDRPCPGKVLLVVVPAKKECDDGLGFDPMLNAVELNAIRTFVQRHASPFVSVAVRNPVYERILVRCSVVLTGHAQTRRGYYLAKLNKAIVDYISPWCSTGYKVRFGWSIRRTDIESHIRSLDFVEFVTGFSMLHISEDQSGNHSLGDTARTVAAEEGSENDTSGEICPSYPWSLAIPVEEHFIEIASSLRSLAADVTGIDKLQVGQTFIIGA